MSLWVQKNLGATKTLVSYDLYIFECVIGPLNNLISFPGNSGKYCSNNVIGIHEVLLMLSCQGPTFRTTGGWYEINFKTYILG